MGTVAKSLESHSTQEGESWRAIEHVDYMDAVIDDLEDARAVVEMLRDLDDELAELRSDALDALGTLASTFETAQTDATFDLMADAGLEELERIADAMIPRIVRGNAEDVAASAALKIATVFAEFGSRRGGTHIAELLNAEVGSDLPGWWRVFNALVPDNPATPEVYGGVDGVPEGTPATEYVSAATYLTAEGFFDKHPLDHDEGRRRLRRWLQGDDDARAAKAAEALRFVSEVDGLIELALEHPVLEVQLEGAGAGLRRGDEASLEQLRRAARDPRTALQALQIFRELDMLDAAPEESLTEDFLATAEMCDWLSHPNEMQRPPDAIEMIDHRVEYWPPANDTRPLRLFRYEYDGEGWQPDFGYGMVGGTTFSLGSTTSDPSLTAEDLYALHCCYELRWNEDPRAPETPTVEAGHELLDWTSPGADGSPS